MRYQQGIRSTAAMIALLGIGTSGITQADDLTKSAPLSCGMVVTHSVVLHGDLVCAGDGLIVGASGITINLNGHALRGTGTGTGIAVGPAQAVSNLKVVGGTIDRFAVGIRAYGNAPGTPEIMLRNLTIAHSANRGIDISSGVKLTISHGRLIDNNFALVGGFGGVFISVFDSYISGNRSGGITVHTIRGTQIVGNTFVGNATGFSAFQSGSNTLVRNQFRANQLAISLTMSRHNTIVSNKVVSNTDGLLAGSDSLNNLISGNQFIGNTAFGMIIGDGLLGTDVSGTSILGNLVRGNGAAGLWFRGEHTKTDGASIIGNQFIGNGYKAAGWLDENGRPLNDGLHIYNPADSGKVEVANNRALRNAGNGIEAAVVVDGGGNTAAGNGESPQCVGVACQSPHMTSTTEWADGDQAP